MKTNAFFKTLFVLSLLSPVTRLFAQENFGTRGTAAVSTISVQEALSKEAAFPLNRPVKVKIERESGIEKSPRPGENSLNNLLPYSPVGFTTTQAVHSNFLATYTGEGAGFYPPDCNGDISSDNQIIVPVNGRMKVYNVPRVSATALTTTQASSTTPLASPVINVDIDAFFSNAGLGITGASDPHVRYDRLSGRWFIAIIDVDHASSNYLIIAMSPTGPLTASTVFTKFYLQSATGSTTPTDDFLDYPTLGIDKSALYIGGNTFNAAGTLYKGSPIYVVNKASLITGTPSFTVWQYGTGAGKSGSNGSVGLWTPQGVHNDDPASTEGYLIGSDNANYSKLDIKRVSNPGNATPTLSADIVLLVPTTSSTITQPSLGSSRGLDALDDRPFAAMLMKDKITGVSSLWTAQNIQVSSTGLGSATGGRNACRWYQIGTLTGTPSLLQSGTLYDPATTNPNGFWIPSIAMSGQGHAVMGFSTASAIKRPQAGIAGRYAGDASGVLQPYDSVTKVTSGFNPLVGTPERWGDYSQTVVDPKDNMTFWSFQTYCNSSNQWGIRAIQVKAPAPPASVTVSSSTSSFCGSAVPVTLTGTVVDNTGFFDPGTDAGGPGFNRLAVTCSGSITVSNLSFVSPTQLTCTINSIGKAAGTYTFTIVNPDGQSTTATFTLSANCTVLPLTLLDFTGKWVNAQTQLVWKTAQEINFNRFEVEKSADGINFNLLDVVSSKGAGTNAYSLIDKNPYPALTYYRLKTVDKDGAQGYSSILTIKSSGSPIVVANMYPNPAKDKFNIEIVADKIQEINISVFDLSGKKALFQKSSPQPGMQTHQLNISALPTGTYLVEIKNAAGEMVGKTKLVKE